MGHCPVLKTEFHHQLRETRQRFIPTLPSISLGLHGARVNGGKIISSLFYAVFILAGPPRHFLILPTCVPEPLHTTLFHRVCWAENWARENSLLRQTNPSSADYKVLPQPSRGELVCSPEWKGDLDHGFKRAQNKTEKSKTHLVESILRNCPLRLSLVKTLNHLRFLPWDVCTPHLAER